MLTNNVSAVFGLQYGDEGKGKIASAMAASKRFSLVARYNGGPNAGHTIMIGDKVCKTRQVPCGALHKVKSYIGPGTVLDLKKLAVEIKTLNDTLGFDIEQYLIIDPRVPIIEEKHIQEDIEKYSVNGTVSTGSGIAPAYKEFYGRTATLAGDLELPYEVREMHRTEHLLLEGAQGIWLDPIHGNYPNCTSSHCLPSFASATFGFSPLAFKEIIGVAKVYETRSGADDYFYWPKSFKGEPYRPNNDQLNKIKNQLEQLQVLGKEFGVNTGRKRACKPLDVTALCRAIRTSGTTHTVIQKLDILREANFWFVYLDGELVKLDNEQEFCKIVDMSIKTYSNCKKITWLSSPYTFYDEGDFVDDFPLHNP